MTDNEIKKALECCTVGTFACGKECPYYSSKSNLKVSSCRFELMCEISDLINRQKAEVERLQNVIFKKEDIMQMIAKEKQEYFDKLQTVKSEAIKEFAERLKSKIWHSPECNYISSITPDYIDNLVKEMTEADK